MTEIYFLWEHIPFSFLQNVNFLQKLCHIVLEDFKYSARHYFYGDFILFF